MKFVIMSVHKMTSSKIYFCKLCCNTA